MVIYNYPYINRIKVEFKVIPVIFSAFNVPYINRIKVEFKAKIEYFSCNRACYINRIKVEFKVSMPNILHEADGILIESKWNLKKFTTHTVFPSSIY